MSSVIRWRGRELKGKVRDAAARGLMLAAEHVLEESDRLVPIEEGTLSRSGTTSVDRRRLRAAVSYNTPYAVRQHEELSWKHDEGRQAKYLEQPLNSEQTTIARIIADEVKGAL